MKVDPEALKKTAQKFVEDALKAAKEFAQVVSKEASSAIKSATEKPPPGTVREPFFNPAGSPRAMRFPYTFTAKVIQFPWVYYLKNNWVYRYYAIALVVTFPIFKKIDNVFNSPANVKKWEEIRRKEREAEQHH